MKTRQQIRKELEAGMSMFLSLGNQVTKLEPQKPKGKRAPPKEKFVEIQVDVLPMALQLKHFGE